MKKYVVLVYFYPIITFGMDGLSDYDAKPTCSLEVLDVFGKRRLDYELMHHDRLVILNDEIYQLNLDSLYCSPKSTCSGS